MQCAIAYPALSFGRDLLMHRDVTRVVTESIRAGTSVWESLVPRHVSEEIKTKHLLGYRSQPQQQLPSHNGSHANGNIGNRQATEQPAHPIARAA